MSPGNGLVKLQKDTYNHLFFSICKTEIMISVCRCFEFQVCKTIPDVNAKLFSLQQESSLGFLILSHFESHVLQ